MARCQPWKPGICMTVPHRSYGMECSNFLAKGRSGGKKAAKAARKVVKRPSKSVRKAVKTASRGRAKKVTKRRAKA